MLEVTVVAIRSVAEDIKLFELASSNGALPACGAGAHVEIDLPLPSGTVQRQYSLLETGNNLNSLAIAVLHERQGRGGSRYMHEIVREGAILRCCEPKNHFPLSEDAAGHLLVAGGIGITPIIAMARRLARESKPFHLQYTARSQRKMAFRQEVDALCGSRATLYIDGGEPSQGMPLHRLVDELPAGWHVYVCGPKGLITAVREAAARKDISEHRIHSESFSAPVGIAGDKPFKAIARDSGVTVEVRGDETLLEALIRAGVDAPFDCKRGECGSCALTVLSGTVDHRDYYLNARERASNKVICCCVSRATGEEIVLEI